MVYQPIKVITVRDWQCEDHIDLSQPLSAFVTDQSYLVVVRDKHYTTLDLSKILLFQKQLSLSKPVGTALVNLLTDQFVNTYAVAFIPGSNPFLNVQGLRVFDAAASKNHEVHFSSVHTPEIIDDPKQKGFLDDLVIVSGENMQHYLVAVNGVFHPTTYHDGKLWVLDGFRTIRLSGKRDITIVDTGRVGGHRIIPLTSNNVEKTSWATTALVTLSESVSNTQVFPVIDGYFHHRDTQVLEWQTSRKAYLHTNKLSLIEQFRHNPRTFLPDGRWARDENPQSRRYTDPFQSVFSQSWFVPTTILQSEAFQYSRLTSFHSFLVVMNNPYLYTVSHELGEAGNPQLFTHQGETYLNGMLRYGCGLCPSYAIWADPEGRQSVFIPEQIGDSDFQLRTGSPSFIPTPDQVTTTGSATMIDYISA